MFRYDLRLEALQTTSNFPDPAFCGDGGASPSRGDSSIRGSSESLDSCQRLPMQTPVSTRYRGYSFSLDESEIAVFLGRKRRSRGGGDCHPAGTGSPSAAPQVRSATHGGQSPHGRVRNLRCRPRSLRIGASDQGTPPSQLATTVKPSTDSTGDFAAILGTQSCWSPCRRT